MPNAPYLYMTDFSSTSKLYEWTFRINDKINYLNKLSQDTYLLIYLINWFGLLFFIKSFHQRATFKILVVYINIYKTGAVGKFKGFQFLHDEKLILP